jgi:plastocyanin
MDRQRRAGLALGIGLAAGVVAGTAQAADRDVTIAGFAFSPNTVTVDVGDTVTWTNEDSQTHTATAGNDWTTGDIAGGDSASVTMRRAGRFDYICAIHPTMTGTVIVRGAGGAAPPSDTEPLPPPDDGAWLTGALAFLGIAMIVGTLIADRRFRRGHPER